MRKVVSDNVRQAMLGRRSAVESRDCLSTYKERESLLELGDLVFGKRISLHIVTALANLRQPWLFSVPAQSHRGVADKRIAKGRRKRLIGRRTMLGRMRIE